MLSTPIVFIVFNRPDHTQKVFDAIKQAKPKHLYVAADGPRDTHPKDKQLCEEVRDIIKQVNWNCEVIKDYAEENMGCRYRPSSGISNAFKYYDRAIILEDDCLPHPDFFRFCEEMLNKYNHTKEVMHISGCSLCSSKEGSDSSYTFSSFSNIWGWATWQHAWQHYDESLSNWPLFYAKKSLHTIITEKQVTEHLEAIFNSIHLKGSTTWDLQWLFSILLNNGLCVTPYKNLVKNIGITGPSTHMCEEDQWVSLLKTFSLNWPLKHPAEICRNQYVDKVFEEKLLKPRPKKTFLQRQKKSINKRLNKIKTIVSRLTK